MEGCLPALALLLATQAQAAPTARLAVLEFNGPNDMEIFVLTKLSDEARGGALEVVRDRGYAVMTRESMAVILKDMGLDAQCQEGECEVETARNIGADLVVSGEVVRIQGRLFLTLKLHESKGGSLLATEAVEAKDELEVVRATRAASQKLLEKGAKDREPAVSASFARGFERPGRSQWNSDGRGGRHHHRRKPSRGDAA